MHTFSNKKMIIILETNSSLNHPVSVLTLTIARNLQHYDVIVSQLISTIPPYTWLLECQRQRRTQPWRPGFMTTQPLYRSMQYHKGQNMHLLNRHHHECSLILYACIIYLPLHYYLVPDIFMNSLWLPRCTERDAMNTNDDKKWLVGVLSGWLTAW